MLTIRLRRAGKKNSPLYRVVLAQKTASATKKFQEILGTYNPRTKALVTNKERLQYWIGLHTEMSPTVHNLFVTNKLVEAKKVHAFAIPKKKTEETK